MAAEYSQLIATLHDRALAAPPDPKIASLVRVLEPLQQEALFVGEFAGDGRYLLLFLHPDGRLLTYNVFFDEFNEFDAESERAWGLRIGSRRYPELAAWIPPQPSVGAVTCADCGGSGWDPDRPGVNACPECDGRGWRADPTAHPGG